MRITKLFTSAQYIILAIILATSFVLMYSASQQESAIMDELAHIPAGYGYVAELDARLNPEHPPLVKIIAALPLTLLELTFPTDSPAWQDEINGQWVTGAQFLYESGNDADQIIQWSRLGPMLLTILLSLLVFFWSRSLMGSWWALIPTTLTAFSPSILAHGHYVTTDIGASLGFILAIYYFGRFMMHSTKKNLVYAGIAYGIAQLLKFSAILLIPLFVFLIVVFIFVKAFNHRVSLLAKLKHFIQYGFQYASYLAGIFVIGYLLVYLVYIPITINYPVEKQVADTTTILTSFGGENGVIPPCEITKPNMRCLAHLDIEMAKHSITRPFAQYTLGVLMVIQRASGGNTGYFLGEVSNTGWWYYFPVVFFYKEPIPSLILLGFALLLGIWTFLKKFRSPSSLKERFFTYVNLNFAEFSMLSFIILYWAYSMKSPLNIGIRHVLPTIPLMYILAAGRIKQWTRQEFDFSHGLLRNLFVVIIGIVKSSFKAAIILFFVVWYIAEAFLAGPYFISYFNEFAGGTASGYQKVTDSNYDWGQDLKRLDTFVEENNIDRIAINYFGGGSPRYYLGDKAVDWNSTMGNPKQEGIEWFAISVNNLQSAIGNPRAGFERKPEDEYLWLLKEKDPHTPNARAGTSIFIYHLK
ncbi:TPA: phospholipid carrier-dependent glycosyltransferase [Candidatus Wolfebacteria bacterium]|uniref:Glycosyl transferase family 39 n=2 Tax=Candidatus Wolfeibacteriota TaxID=1752735 RepID=A0A0G1X622_9BACT|nr:MAG: glycosyl transferase family protein [Candidatus Wolfebacteria bacterium GW2011_GWB1_47_1]KKU42232.1 MAG: Glycosyl transferase family 39 [Candidatus Wolfebacteria bacterium GW2011_GWB2_46_69]KKU59420.1 MAG: Glycosyl transferase family 39 [Candidatus Wolfebacteria bacterium GW2011_GWE2_47_12]KKU65544.1 MAG: Glycosyl transferase family 39 [Candidatus Wolfebacteria bacterium GW2011_GWD2_47_17]KKU76102.1 MAG: Glycosyl transferase family 39 [Candidatus Wolfebacteria bacterium GW2011_GWA1_47_6